MLTPEQEKWIETLSDRIISIVPYDPCADEIFNKVKERIVSVLGLDVQVEHSGATIFGLPGQDEVDVAIVVDKEKFAEYIPKLETVFGPVQALYPDRARFEVKQDGKKIDLKIVDMNQQSYIEGKIFEKYLKDHPEDIERYKAIKEECNGLVVKEYQRRKTSFINEILEKAKNTND